MIYLAHPRTASVATSIALKHAGFEKLEPPSDHHSRLWDEGTPVTRANRATWTVFTTVRNHWDTVVSWMFRRFRTRTAEEILWDVETMRTALDVRWVNDSRLWWLHGDDADTILRYETLERDLRQLLAEHGIVLPHLNVLNASSNRQTREYRRFYVPATQDYVASRFGDEARRFGYVF